MNIIIFEDKSTDDLRPFSINHGSFELRIGRYSNIERIINSFDQSNTYCLVVRSELKDLIQKKFPKYTVNPKIIPPGLYLNGAVIWNKEDISKVSKGHAFSNAGNLVSFNDNKENDYNNFFNHILNEKSSVTSDVQVNYISYLWDCFDKIKEVLEHDKVNLSQSHNDDINQFSVLINKSNIYLSETAKIEPGCILDARNGPIIFDDNVIIESGSIIKGPVYLGHDTIINNGAKLKGNIIIGPKCKIGGEVTNSIFHGYSNKQHDGFIGHSFIGEWVNLGANTNNSNLKNNYGKVTFHFTNKHLGKWQIKTNRIFLGVMIGDFTRTGISTMINTGSYIGLGANVFGGGFQDKCIDSFAWGKTDITDFHKLIETIKIIKSRRSESLSDTEISFLKSFYSMHKSITIN